MTFKEYIIIKQAIKYTITWANKAWLKLMQISHLASWLFKLQ